MRREKANEKNAKTEARLLTIQWLLERGFGDYVYYYKFGYSKEEYCKAFCKESILRRLRERGAGGKFWDMCDDLVKVLSKHRIQSEAMQEWFIGVLIDEDLRLSFMVLRNNLLSKGSEESPWELYRSVIKFNADEASLLFMKTYEERDITEFGITKEDADAMYKILSSRKYEADVERKLLGEQNDILEEHSDALKEAIRVEIRRVLQIIIAEENESVETPIFAEDILTYLDDEKKQKIIDDLLKEDFLREFEPGVYYRPDDEECTDRITKDKVITYKYLRHKWKNKGYFVLYDEIRQSALGEIRGELVSNAAPTEPIIIEFAGESYLLRKPYAFISRETCPLLMMMDCAKIIQQSDENAGWEERVIHLFRQCAEKTGKESGLSMDSISLALVLGKA